MSSRFCPNCGKEIFGNQKFCDECGVDLQGAKDVSHYRNSSGKKSKLIPIIIAVVVLIAAVAGYFIWRSNYKEITLDLTGNASKHVLTYVGTDKSGKVKIDEVAMRKAIGASDKRATEFVESVSFEADKTDNLANGDEVVVTAKYPSELDNEKHIKVKGDSRTFVVSGLKAPESKEPKKVVIQYDATNPYDYSLKYNSKVYDYNNFYLTESDVSGWNRAQLQRGINDICAMNGREFKDDNQRAYYSNFSWYNPTYSADYFDDRINSILSSTELANYRLLVKYRDRY